MKLQKFIFDLSSLITDFEIDPNPSAKQVSLMAKVLVRLIRDISKKEKKKYKSTIIEMKNRITKIKPRDVDKETILDLRTDIEALEAIIQIKDGQVIIE